MHTLSKALPLIDKFHLSVCLNGQSERLTDQNDLVHTVISEHSAWPRIWLDRLRPDHGQSQLLLTTARQCAHKSNVIVTETESFRSNGKRILVQNPVQLALFRRVPRQLSQSCLELANCSISVDLYNSNDISTQTLTASYLAFSPVSSLFEATASSEATSSSSIGSAF